MPEDRPAFLFYTKDWAASTRAFSAEVRGAYIHLLAYAWDNNGLPTDEEDLRLIAGVERSSWKRVWDKLAPKWVEQDGVLINCKLERVRVESEAYTLDKQSLGRAGGRASAKARAEKYGSAAPRTGSRTGSREQPPNQLHEPVHEPVHEVVPEPGSPERTKPASASTRSLSSLRSERDAHADAIRAGEKSPFEFDPNDPGPHPARRRRPQAAWEGRSLYVTHQQHHDFVGRLTLGGMADHDADRELRAWYVATEDDLRARGVVPGANIFRFWDEAFAARPDVAQRALRAAPDTTKRPELVDISARIAAEAEERRLAAEERAARQARKAGLA